MARVVTRPLALGLITTFLMAASVHAQSWPTKPIRIVVPYPAGGNADAIARTIAKPLSKRLGQPIIVDNRAGASGLIGADSVAKAPADGYTLLVTPDTQLRISRLGTVSPYVAAHVFRPIAGIVRTPLVYAATAEIGAVNFSRFVEYARGRRLTYGSYGNRNSTHLLIERLNGRFHLGMNHLPYRGESPMLTELLAGVVHTGLLPVGTTKAQVDAGKVVPLAILASRRSPAFPEVPTFAELGLKELDWECGVAMYAPAALPDAIAFRLEAQMHELLADADVRAALLARQNEEWGASSEELTQRMAIDTVKWAAVLGHFKKQE